MDNLPAPPLHDAVRFIRKDPKESEFLLREYYDAAPRGVSLAYARRNSSHALSHSTQWETIALGCARLKTGADLNKEVLRYVWEAGEGRSIRTLPSPPRHWYPNPRFKMRITPTFFFIENQRPYLFVLQPRRQYGNSADEFSLIASAVKIAFDDEEFDVFGQSVEAGVEILDLSCPEGSKVRHPYLYKPGSLPLLSEKQLLERFAPLVEAHARLQQSGYSRPPRPKRNTDHPGQGDLFA